MTHRLLAVPHVLVVLLTFGFVVVIILAVRSARRLDLRRAVLVRVPRAEAWNGVSDVRVLLGRHSRPDDRTLIDSWTLQHGDGPSAGSVWRAHGRRDGLPYWADLEVVRLDPPREIRVSLVRDVLGMERRLRGHAVTLRLEAIDPGTTKLTWNLSARLGPVLALRRLVSLPRLQGQLFDRSLRSIKASVEKESSPAETGPGVVPPSRSESPRAPVPQALDRDAGEPADDRPAPGARRAPRPPDTTL